MRLLPMISTLLYGVAIPPVLALVVWNYYLKFDTAYLVQGWAFRFFTLLFVALLFLEIVRNILRRTLFPFFLHFGMLLVLIHGFLWYGYRFDGMAAVGTNEQITDFNSYHIGTFTTPPRIPLKIVSVTATPKSVTLVRDGIETRLEIGEKVERDGFELALTGVEQAPLIAVRSVIGELIDEAYLKNINSGSHGDFLMFGRLPHRFYVNQLPKVENHEAQFRLRVVRDKLTIIDAVVNDGESVYFDGHNIICRPGALWARISVEKRQSGLLLWGGILLVAAGLIGGAVQKRSVKT